MRNSVALLMSPLRRQTKPGERSARALTRSRLSMNSAMRGSVVGYLNLPMLSSARCISLLRRHAGQGALVIRIMAILIDTFFNDVTEMADKALHGPGSGIA